jgi:peptidoglycan/xylan/chitin deacetylase (PgdA/CDA1 family)
MMFVRTLIFMIGDLIGLNWLFRRTTSAKVRVLMYHSITSRRAGAFCWTVLDRDEFVWQMEYLSRHYDIRAASEVFANVGTQNDAPVKTTVITFDDGLENTFSEAWPVLSRLNLKAICFVLPALSQRDEQIWADDLFEFLIHQLPGDLDLNKHDLGSIRLDPDPDKRAEAAAVLLEKTKSWTASLREELLSGLLPDEKARRKKRSGVFKLMSIDQINQLAASREFEIGLHSDTHPIMSSLSAEEQEREMRASIEKLKLGEIRYVPIFAYPNGRLQDFNEDTLNVLKRLNLRTAMTTVDGMWNRGKDPLKIPRIPVGADTSRWEFKARLSGFFYFLAGLKGGKTKDFR